MWNETTNGYVTEASSIPKGKYPECPKCKKPVYEAHRTGTDRDNENEVTGWRFKHPCGANLLIIND